MTAEEIRRDYRLAKYPRKQIKILAELNAITPDEICEIIGIQQQQPVREKPRKWTEDEINILIKMLGEGAQQKDIDKAVGHKNICAKIKELRKMGKITWTPELDAQLIQMKTAGSTYREIAEELGTTKGAIENRVYRLRQNGKKPAASEVQVDCKPIATESNPDEPHITVHVSELIAMGRAMGVEVDHMVIDTRNGVTTLLASGDDADGKCVELSVTRHKAVV